MFSVLPIYIFPASFQTFGNQHEFQLLPLPLPYHVLGWSPIAQHYDASIAQHPPGRACGGLAQALPRPRLRSLSPYTTFLSFKDASTPSTVTPRLSALSSPSTISSSAAPGTTPSRSGTSTHTNASTPSTVTPTTSTLSSPSTISSSAAQETTPS